MAGILDYIAGLFNDPNNPQKNQGILNSATGVNTVQPVANSGVLNQNAPQVAPQATQQAPVDPNSFGQRFANADWGTHLMALSRGLAAAGSRDPVKAANDMALTDMEGARTKVDVAKAKVQPIAGGAAYMITEPGKEPRVVSLPEMQKYLLDVKKIEYDNSLAKLVLGKQLDANLAGVKDDVKRSGDAREQLNNTENLISGWKQAQQIVTSQAANNPNGAKLQGVSPGIAGFFGGDQVAANNFLTGLSVDETLLNTAKTKGAISDKEMALFKSPIPGLTDDRETVWKPYIEKRLEVLNKIKAFQESEVARGENPGARVGGGSSSPKPLVVPGLSEGASKYFYNK